MPRDAVPATAGWRAALDLGFERRGERTVLARRHAEGPLVVQKSLHPEGDRACHAIVVHPPAGIAGGDVLELDVNAASRAHAVLTTPGAAKWYRSAGARASQHVRISAGDAATVEWMPQENIVYDGARAEITWRAELAADARLLAWDVFCLGRTGAGESFTRGECRIASSLCIGGRLAWRERAMLRAGDAALDGAAGLAGQPVFGTFIAAAAGLDAACLEACREETPARGEGAATRLPAAIIARYRGDSTESARNYFIALWRRLRERVAGLAPVEPRIWRT